MIEIKNSVEIRKMFSSIKTLIELNIHAVPSSFNMTIQNWGEIQSILYEYIIGISLSSFIFVYSYWELSTSD